ncbi:MAG: hypothetical protein RLZZ283_551 [Candidatus Parcubacteria bacterium]
MWTFLLDLISYVIPRHPDAEYARRVSRDTIESLLSPRILREEPWIHTILPYERRAVRSVIKSIKFYGEVGMVELIAPVAADYLTDVLSDLAQTQGWRDALIVPVPTSRARLSTRGYNQAALIARAIAGHIDGIECLEVLGREDRKSQIRAGTRAERKRNIANSFYVTDPARVARRCIVLIDDVVETGATLADCRRALIKAGASRVIALAIAH